MSPDDLFIKTDKGREEIEKRTYRLSPTMRRVLIMIDGKTSVEQLIDNLDTLINVKKALATLEADGFILKPVAAETTAPAPSPAEPAIDLDAAKRSLADLIFKDLGHESGQLIVQVGECQDPAQLLQYIGKLKPAYERTVGAERAEQLWQTALDLLDRQTA